MTTTAGRDRGGVQMAGGLGLVARTRRIGSPGSKRAAALDLVAAAGADGVVWQDGSHGLAGRGTALRIDLPGGLAAAGDVAAVHRTLASIDTVDGVGRPGCGPVALGALPFAPAAPGTLVVPEVLIGRSGDDAWITTVNPSRDTSGEVDAVVAEMLADARSGRRRPVDAPDEFRLVSTIPQSEWRDMVSDAIQHIRAGALRKVVLARRISVGANRPIVTSDVLGRLLALYPACMVFRVEGFIGASPELLIERRGSHVRSHPLAGTIARSGDLVVDEALVAGLLASKKERSEHRFVIDDLRAALEPVCTTLEVPDQPSILELRNVSHLATFIDGELAPHGATAPRATVPTAPRATVPTAPRATVPTALELVARVHPTAAVGGTPTGAAVAYIQRYEGFDRGRYAGPVGWVDARGDGSWAIGIRSADVSGDHASMYAGVGIVAESDPEAELAETQLKLQALLAALVRP